MTPPMTTDKHQVSKADAFREMARDVLEMVEAMPSEGNIHLTVNALDEAYRRGVEAGVKDGMRRAAEIVRDQGPATQDMTSTMICDALDGAADAILSEIEASPAALSQPSAPVDVAEECARIAEREHETSPFCGEKIARAIRARFKGDGG